MAHKNDLMTSKEFRERILASSEQLNMRALAEDLYMFDKPDYYFEYTEEEQDREVVDSLIWELEKIFSGVVELSTMTDEQSYVGVATIITWVYSLETRDNKKEEAL